MRVPEYTAIVKKSEVSFHSMHITHETVLKEGCVLPYERIQAAVNFATPYQNRQKTFW